MLQEPKSKQQRAARVILLTMLTVVIVLFAASAWMIYQNTKAENHIRYITYKKLVAEKMAITINAMEMNAKMVFGEVGKHLESPESVVEVLSNTSYLAPDVRGYFAAFEPNHFPEKGKWFEPYMHQEDSNGFSMRQVGSPRHDYTKIANMDWAVAIVVPQHSISPSMRTNGMVLLLISVIGIVIGLFAYRKAINV